MWRFGGLVSRVGYAYFTAAAFEFVLGGIAGFLMLCVLLFCAILLQSRYWSR